MSVSVVLPYMFRSLTLTIFRGIVPVATLLSALLSSSQLYLGMWLYFLFVLPSCVPSCCSSCCILSFSVLGGCAYAQPPNTLKDSIQQDEQQEGTHDGNTNRK